jgi:hypothetical protein
MRFGEDSDLPLLEFCLLAFKAAIHHVISSDLCTQAFYWGDPCLRNYSSLCTDSKLDARGRTSCPWNNGCRQTAANSLRTQKPDASNRDRSSPRRRIFPSGIRERRHTLRPMTNNLGITAFVLEYRHAPDYQYPAPILN